MMEFRDLFIIWRTANELKQIEAAELIGICVSSYNKFEKYGICGPTVLSKLQAYYRKNLVEFGGEVNV